MLVVWLFFIQQEAAQEITCSMSCYLYLFLIFRLLRRALSHLQCYNILYRPTQKGWFMAYNDYWNDNWNDPRQNLIYYMELRNMSYEQLAEKSGVKQATIEGWRRDRTTMLHAQAESVVRVCEVLRVRPSYMLGLDADPRRAQEEQRQLGTSVEARMLQAIFGRDASIPDGPPPRKKRKKRVENKPRKDMK